MNPFKNNLHLQSTIYKLHIYTTYLLPWHGLVSPPPPASQAWSGDWTPRCEASRKSSSGSRTSADPGPGTWSASPRSSSTPGPIRGEHRVSTNHSSPGPGRRWAGAAASWALSWAGRAAAARGTVCLCSRGTRAACGPPPPGSPG